MAPLPNPADVPSFLHFKFKLNDVTSRVTLHSVTGRQKSPPRIISTHEERRVQCQDGLAGSLYIPCYLATRCKLPVLCMRVIAST